MSITQKNSEMSQYVTWVYVKWLIQSGYIFKFVQSYLLSKTFMGLTDKLNPEITTNELSALSMAFKV